QSHGLTNRRMRARMSGGVGGGGATPPPTRSSSLRKHSGQKPRARQRAWPGYGAIPCTVRAVTGQIPGAAGHRRSCEAWSAAWPSPLGVVSEALPGDQDTGLVTDDPRIVAGWHDGEVPRAVLHLFPVVHDDLHPAGNEVGPMVSLAAGGRGDR